MAKEAYYFTHDFGARNDPKLQKVLMRLGQEGKGVYWDLVEMLFEEGGLLLLSECESYAFALRTNEKCILSLIKDFGLFDFNEVSFWSNSVNRRISEREVKSEKARNSALNRWNNANASKKNATALTEKCEGNALKEKKGKEINIYSEFSFFNEAFEKTWDSFKKSRVKLKKPLTLEAERLNLMDLKKIANEDNDLAIKIVNQTVKNGWQGFFPLKKEEATLFKQPVKFNSYQGGDVTN